MAEFSCEQCQFELDSENGCSLAVRIDDKVYFVEGFKIDDFGDAYDKHTGFYKVIKKGEVVASYIKLVD
ncbi:DUF6370 family protein [Polaribacter sp. KT25b]|uniref:DUF6370 family protein n=1 Tax=Polaribacter sp. KT25b TaxID=1855336 RepID=UPI001E54BFFF|nr:DUF6370 family protein [Polaribacter sp. KT25b]